LKNKQLAKIDIESPKRILPGFKVKLVHFAIDPKRTNSRKVEGIEKSAKKK